MGIFIPAQDGGQLEEQDPSSCEPQFCSEVPVPGVGSTEVVLVPGTENVHNEAGRHLGPA